MAQPLFTKTPDSFLFAIFINLDQRLPHMIVDSFISNILDNILFTFVLAFTLTMFLRHATNSTFSIASHSFFADTSSIFFGNSFLF